MHAPTLPNRRFLLAFAFCSAVASRRLAAQEPLALRITSSEAEGELKGAVEATTPHPFETVAAALGSPQAWCDILMLHLNNKSCALRQDADGPRIALAIARKHDQSVEQAHVLELRWRSAQASAQRLVVRLDAKSGPLGSSDYAVVLTVSPLSATHTRIGFSYACRFGTPARLLLQSYLATLGRDKVGFTVQEEGQGARLVGGLRGIVERTAMRYYLAIDAWLQTLPLPPERRALARLERWFDATERHPRQLHEVDRATYLQAKRRELGLPG